MKKLALIFALLLAMSLAIGQGQGKGKGHGDGDGGGKQGPSKPNNPPGKGDGGGNPKPSNPPQGGNGGGGGSPKPSNPPQGGNGGGGSPANPPHNGGNGGGGGGSNGNGGGSSPANPPRNGGGGSNGNGGNGGGYSPYNPPRTGGGSSKSGGGDSERYGDQGRAYLDRKPTQADYFKRQNRTETGPIFAPRTGGNGTRSNNNVRNLISKPMNPAVPPIQALGAINPRSLGNNNGGLMKIEPKDKFRIFHDGRNGNGGGNGNSGGNGGRGGNGGGYRDGYRDGYDNGFWDGYRFGYFHYDPYWRDCHFGYHWWIFDPWREDCYFSPYYSYWSLPPYLGYDRCRWNPWRVIIVVGGDLRWYYCGRGYSNSGYDNSYNASRLDRALSDLVDAFRYADSRSLQNLIQRGGEVDIYIDGDYAYSVPSDDYYDMTSDLIYSVYTTNFEILNVRRARGGEFWVSARHSYLDSWNREQTVYMSFTLVYVDGRFVIVQAGTGTNRYNPPTNY